MKKNLCIIIAVVVLCLSFSGCSLTDEDSVGNRLSTNTTQATAAASQIVKNQPAPTDIDYSLERYNLIRRAYWVNGQREKANALVCSVTKPMGYVVLLSDDGAVVGKFTVDGKVSSLNSYLFPASIDTDYAGRSPSSSGGAGQAGGVYSTEIPGIDGAYGSNATGIFFFTIDGKYIEWNGKYLYSDIPFEVKTPVVNYQAAS